MISSTGGIVTGGAADVNQFFLIADCGLRIKEFNTEMNSFQCYLVAIAIVFAIAILFVGRLR
jgi:hypothetical protein